MKKFLLGALLVVLTVQVTVNVVHLYHDCCPKAKCQVGCSCCDKCDCGCKEKCKKGKCCCDE